MTGTLTLLWLLGITAPAGVPGASDLSRFEFSGVEMAVPIRIVLYAGDKETAAGAAEAALKRIGQLNDILSDYDPRSELRRLCVTSGPGNPVPVGPDLWKVLTAAQSLSKRSEGAFDVTVGPVVRLWR
ncbi:MAG: FAD:protein FMN transferase, partial [Planctomycetes bacterium]|nr:FAD:protein FMN transferase [Planctomycetota bacterium]